MTKRLINSAIAYAILAMAGGVFFREYTKFTGFSGATDLALVHVHYFVLGMLMLLVLAVIEKSAGFLSGKRATLWLVTYHVGLNITVAGLFIRGLAQVRGDTLPGLADAALSGMSGLGHILLGISLLAILLLARKKLA